MGALVEAGIGSRDASACTSLLMCVLESEDGIGVDVECGWRGKRGMECLVVGRKIERHGDYCW